MAKISFGKQNDESKFSLDVLTNGASQTEITVGDQSGRSIRDVTIKDLPPGLNMSVLAEELARMHLALRDQGTGPQDERDMILDAAQSAARAGDHSGTAKLLRQAGKWALDLAMKVGADVAATAIKGILGMA